MQRAGSISGCSDGGSSRPAAVAALEESNRLKSGQSKVLANLGLANLIHPEGKKLTEATRLLSEAAAAEKDHESLNPISHAGLLINLGVATLADGKAEAGLAKLDEGEKVVRSFILSPAGRRMATSFDAALLYTRALALAGSKKKEDQEKAADLFENYLESCSTLSLWWGVAFDRYQDVCKAVNRKAKTLDAFKKDRPEPVRLSVGVTLKSGINLVLGDDVDDVVKKLGKGKETVVVPSINLKKLRYESLGKIGRAHV